MILANFAKIKPGHDVFSKRSQDFAELILGRAEGATRGLNPSDLPRPYLYSRSTSTAMQARTMPGALRLADSNG